MENIVPEITLFNGSGLSVKDFSHLFIIYASKHCLSDNAKTNLLNMFQIVLPDSNNCPSLYMVEKIAGSIAPKPIQYNLCSQCHSEVSNYDLCVNEQCVEYSTNLPVKDRFCYKY